MFRKELDLHLEALAGFINDEDKLVTYKWLSKELGIHVNLSKQILFEYWEKHRKEKNSLTATFLLIGYQEDGGMKVEVVKEEDLASLKNNFTKIIAEHVYSLQKTLPALELLAISDNGDCAQSAVRCNEAVIRSDHEMEVLRWGSILPKNNVQNSVSKVQKQNNTGAIKTADQSSNVNKETVPKPTAPKPTQSKTQKSAFNNLFAKAIDKQNKEKNAASVSSDKTTHKTTVPKTVQTNSVQKNSWFEAAKKPTVQKEENKNDEVASNSSKKQKISVIVDSDDSDGESPSSKNEGLESTSKSKIDDKIEKRKKKSPERSIATTRVGAKKKAASSSRGKKRQSSSTTESLSKRRKRIVIVESSGESSDSDMEDIREPDSPGVPEVTEKVKSCPSPPLIKCEGGRKKVRKLVDKTFMDEDGYFVTQKEYVYESCSDKEEELAAGSVKPSTSEPAVKNVNKRKQASLLNFFKKS